LLVFLRCSVLFALSILSIPLALSAGDRRPSKDAIRSAVNEQLAFQRFCLDARTLPAERGRAGQGDLLVLPVAGSIELPEGRTDGRGREIAKVRWRGRMATPGPWAADGGYRNIPAQTETHTRSAVFEAVLFRTAGGWKADAVEAGMMSWRAGRTPAASSRGVAATPVDLRGRSEREPDFHWKSEEYRAWMDVVDAIAAEVGVTGADGRSFAETFWHDKPERSKLVALADIAKVVFSYDRRLGSDPALKEMAYACAGMIRLALAMERRRA
jgi:hypothetical protein